MTTSLFEMEVDERDFVTGELKKSTKAKVVKKPKTPDFLMLFTAGAPLLKDACLTKSSELILSKILEKWVLRKNRVDLSKVLVAHLVTELGSSRSTIYTGLTLLKNKKILVQDKEGITGDLIKGAWYLNPYIFGKGSWNDISKLRFDLSVEFDFKKLEASSKATRTAEYEEESLEKIKNGEYAVVDHSINFDDSTNTTEAEIVVEDADTTEKNTEIYLLKEKNKSLELEIQLKLANTEELKSKIEAKKLGII